jgi:perosamine synthetase
VIPVAAPDIGELEERYVSQAVRSTWVSSTGEFLDRAEALLAQVSGCSHVVPVANGTVALHVALAALGIGPGDEVIVPSLTYIASVNAVTYTGATPVFADVEASSWGLDAAAVDALVTSRTKAIVMVHLYGMPADVSGLRAVADAYGLALVEDAAEAPFASYGGRPVGSLGDVATFSFYGNKVVTSGEGGALTTSDPELAARIRLLRGQGMDPKRRYYFPEVGYNYRLTNVAAALLCAQLERADELLARRWDVYRGYEAGLADVVGLTVQGELAGRTRTPWLYPLLVDDAYGESRDELMGRLAADGVETRPFFLPVHTMPPYQTLAERQCVELPVTNDLAARGLNLPTYAGLGAEDVQRIVALLGGAS